MIPLFRKIGYRRKESSGWMLMPQGTKYEKLDRLLAEAQEPTLCKRFNRSIDVLAIQQFLAAKVM